MRNVDLDAVVATLDPDGRGGRRGVEAVSLAVQAIAPDVEAAAVAELVRETIDRGEREGRWSASRTATVLSGVTVLPKSVLLPRRKEPPERRRTIDTPLRHELSTWATGLLLSVAQREVLLAVNEWLRRTNGGKVPVIATAERAYEVLGDEKAFDSSPPRGGTTLWQSNRLTFGLLRCERVPTPLTWEPVSLSATGAGRIVCVENHATFRTLLRVLRESPSSPWAAVAWVQGRNTAPLESLPSLPFSVTRLDYLGDLDAAGLEIAFTACATAENVGVRAGPACRLWELLIDRSSRPGRAVDVTHAKRLVGWLPQEVRGKAFDLLTEGRVIPQEALRYDLLRTLIVA
ncbi:hypothetical protein C8D87_105273 [Lentzea atacamensis]|uniref:Wadjet protein JetD C-terminal domain-containing protein n=1 Tax=Lentzea atacamensis TaxID=531938 RepID=A0ABX9E613_9PSEU|nr:hypothetical protein C8D87_105273 [Lentzea atacamensis]